MKASVFSTSPVKPNANAATCCVVSEHEVPASVRTTTASVPKYSLQPVEGGIKISVQLPKVNSISEIDLDVTPTACTLEVAGVYHLVVKSTFVLNDDDVAAKWIKQDRILEVVCGLAAK